jgi:hypothetical protein
MKSFFKNHKLIDMKHIAPFFKAIILLLMPAVWMLSCKQESFDYIIPEAAAIKIDSIDFSAGSSSLIADGQASLSFIIQAYSKKQVTINGVARDSMVLIPADRIPAENKKVFDENGKESGLSFSTTSTTPATKSFYAKIGDKQSVTRQVTINAADPAYTKIVIPVVIHVFELKKTDAKRYPWYVEVDYKRLQDMVAGMNTMFNRKGTSAPNGTSANIEFVLAPNGPDGRPLEKAGYNMFEYLSTMNWGFGTATAATFIKANAAKLLWNPKKYLNIWVLPSAVFYGGITNAKPGYTLSATPLPGLTLQKVASVDNVPLTEPEKVGLMIGHDELYSALRGPAPNIGWRLGNFYGLFRTYSYFGENNYTDYCTDTQKWAISQFRNVYKVSSTGILFQAENVMDATFTDSNIEGGQNLVSRVNTFTVDQVKRIRYVVQNCPERMAWQ